MSLRASPFRWLVFSLASTFAALSGVHAQSAVRINVGSTKAWTDSKGNVWQPDAFTIGRAFSTKCVGDVIAGTIDDTIYCTNRYFTKALSNNGPYLMDVPISQTGSYLVRLHFAETVSLCRV